MSLLKNPFHSKNNVSKRFKKILYNKNNTFYLMLDGSKIPFNDSFFDMYKFKCKLTIFKKSRYYLTLLFDENGVSDNDDINDILARFLKVMYKYPNRYFYKPSEYEFEHMQKYNRFPQEVNFIEKNQLHKFLTNKLLINGS